MFPYLLPLASPSQPPYSAPLEISFDVPKKLASAKERFGFPQKPPVTNSIYTPPCFSRNPPLIPT